MGQILPHRPVLLIVAAFSRYAEGLAWGKERAIATWGALALESPLFDHEETKYYAASMGPGLKKTFWALELLIDPAKLVDCKLATNDWEEEYQRRGGHPEVRPLNLDPGYITEAKLVLATTKDRDHRLYLDQGIYAEGTLHYSHGSWQIRPWTYPDYQRADYHAFFLACRDYLRARYRTGS